MSQIKAIIFDMDGVLVNAKIWHFNALNRALALFGLAIPYKQHLREFDGLPTRMKLEKLSRTKSLPRALHGFISEMKQHYTMQEITRLCKPNKTRHTALKRLKDEGYALALASNSIKSSVQAMVEKSDLDAFLRFYLSNEDVKNPKPSPEIYERAIEMLGVLPREALILEDNINGIRAALGSGANVLEIEKISQVNYATIKAAIRVFENRKNPSRLIKASALESSDSRAKIRTKSRKILEK